MNTNSKKYLATKYIQKNGFKIKNRLSNTIYSGNQINADFLTQSEVIHKMKAMNDFSANDSCALLLTYVYITVVMIGYIIYQSVTNPNNLHTALIIAALLLIAATIGIFIKRKSVKSDTFSLINEAERGNYSLMRFTVIGKHTANSEILIKHYVVFHGFSVLVPDELYEKASIGQELIAAIIPYKNRKYFYLL